MCGRQTTMNENIYPQITQIAQIFVFLCDFVSLREAIYEGEANDD